ncbi:ParB/RepB/Spo0J family partition protein [Desulfatirhabdium butyrativorans]|uniref:ParB/RepB/Spo0J family partition protein n=1 Tax=Desulfatirhabdium butyrativorans TaxID=340467 RepID=UPI0004132EA7|nr:ParB/RepB/Spo0J family partition protein [Desulfatirhabdium butyrativorans]
MTIWIDQTVEIDRIDRADRSLAITTKTAIEELARHIGHFGLLAPPLVRERQGRLGIVAGFRRIDACHLLGWRTLAVRVMEASDAACIEAAIADNTGERALDWIETMRAYALLRRQYPDEPTLVDRAQALGLPASADVLRKVADLALLPEQLQHWLLADVLPLSMALELGKLSLPDALAVGGLFEKLKLGLNKQRELLGYLQEIAGRDRREIHRLLADREIADILEDERIDSPRKAHLIRNVLRKCRYPKISAFGERYRKRLAELRLPRGIALTPPENFEGGIWRWAIDFEKIPELREKLGVLQGVCDHPALSEMLQQSIGTRS